ncbi:MAG: hypothetical protein AB8B92_00975 [Gammaproteobacteria bacterium]
MRGSHYTLLLSSILVWSISINTYADTNSDNYVVASYEKPTPITKREVTLLNNTRWAFDVSARRIRNLEQDEWYEQDVYGFDLHKVFSNENGDYGTLVFQPYLVNLTNIPKAPFFFDDGDDWELTWRIANFNYTGLAQGKLNIRLGHFEVPFGLEQNIDTNGTLRQYTFSSRGVKADWGISINGNLPVLDYEFALTRGSSNDIRSQDDPYVLAGRVGTPNHFNTIYGFSYFYGEVLGDTGTTKRKQLGLDIAHYFKQFEFLTELSAGENEETELVNWLGEISWRNINESIHLYSQTRTSYSKIDGNWENGLSTAFGIDWDFTNQLSFSSQLAYDLDNLSGVEADTTATIQLRIRI